MTDAATSPRVLADYAYPKYPSTRPDAGPFVKPHIEPRSDVDLLADLALDLATRNGKVTADDLRVLAPNAPNKSANYGAAFRKLVQSGQLVLVTFQHSQAPGNNGRRIGVYSRPIKPFHRVCP